MRNIVEIQTDHIIRIIQHRAWEDFGEALSYEGVRYFLITGKTGVLTQMQTVYIDELRREIDAAEYLVSQGCKRRKAYFDSGLITSRNSYRRIFYPKG